MSGTRPLAPATPEPQPIGLIFHMPLDGGLRPIETLLHTTYCRLAPEAAPELAPVMDLAEVQRRLANGRRCYVAHVLGALAAYGWVSFDEEHVGENGLQVRLLPGEAYIWDCATLPAYRRQGLYAALLVYMAQALQADGLRAAWIGSDYNNSPSTAGIVRAGFTSVSVLVAAPPAPGEQRQRGWLQANPGVSAEQLTEARRVFLGGRDEAWLQSDW